MKIELKNIKYSEFASHETYCFEATVYVDGQRAFSTSNDGQGGCSNYHKIKGGRDDWRQLIAELDAQCKTETIESAYGDIQGSLETYIFDLVSKWLQAKDLKKILKRISYIKGDGKLYQLPAKFKPKPEILQAVKNANWWQSSNVLLNELTFEDAQKHYDKLAA